MRSPDFHSISRERSSFSLACHCNCDSKLSAEVISGATTRARSAAGRPTHPLAQALLPLRGRRDVDLARLHEMLVAADLDLAQMTYRSWQELDAYLFRASGTLQSLIAATLAGERGLAPAEREFASRLGAAVRQAEMLAGLRRDLARGRMYAPTEALETAGIDPVAFASAPGADICDRRRCAG